MHIINISIKEEESLNGTGGAVLENQLALFVGLFILIENIFTFIVLLRCDKILLQIRTLSLTLCLTDLFCGLNFTVPDFFHEIIFQCRFKKYPQAVLATMSILTVSMINADRCLAFYYGINYYIRVTNRRVKIAVFFMWLFCISNTYITFYDQKFPFGICCAGMEFTPNDTLNSIGKFTNVVILFSNIFFYCYIVRSIKSKEQKEVVAKLSIITGCVLVTCAPGLLVFAFCSMNKRENRLYFLYTGLFLLFNSIMNPFLYVWRFKDARYQCKKLLCFWNRSFLEREALNRKETQATYRISAKSVQSTSVG